MLGSSSARQLGRLGSPAAKEVMEDALWPGSRNIRALTWPTFAARRNWQLDRSTARQVGQPGGKGSHGRCAVARLSKHPRPDLANICGPAELQLDSSAGWAARRQESHGRCSGLARESIPALTWPNIGDPLSRARNSSS